MLIKNITNLIRNYYAGSNKQFVFKKSREPLIKQNLIDNIHLYIHIPFCKHNCPYCPYNKTIWDPNIAKFYYEALTKEIEIYHNILGEIVISSIYFGGGSPSISPIDFYNIVNILYSKFKINGDICIEINPIECDNERLKILRDSNVKIISVGVQSFQDKNLLLLGRDYNEKIAKESIDNVRKIFDNVNIDLMFALKGQTLNDIELDLNTSLSYGVNQITVYPLFTFPYSTIGKYKKLKKIKMPSLLTRRRQYYFIYDFLTSNGFERVSVWSFLKGNYSRYSSVTRDGYLGFGAGAGTHLPYAFYLNTFSINEYINRLKDNKFPTALEFNMSEYLNNLFWLYWRFYDTRIPILEFEKRFSNNNKINNLINIFIKLNMLIKHQNEFILTRKGSFWLHLAQNYFSLNYINKIWSVAMKEPFPELIYF